MSTKAQKQSIVVNDILNELKADIDINDIENIRNKGGEGAKVVIKSSSKLYFLYFIY